MYSSLSLPASSTALSSSSASSRAAVAFLLASASTTAVALLAFRSRPEWRVPAAAAAVAAAAASIGGDARGARGRRLAFADSRAPARRDPPPRGVFTRSIDTKES